MPLYDALRDVFSSADVSVAEREIGLFFDPWPLVGVAWPVVGGTGAVAKAYMDSEIDLRSMLLDHLTSTPQSSRSRSAPSATPAEVTKRARAAPVTYALVGSTPRWQRNMRGRKRRGVTRRRRSL